jgi:hypothetical protein
MKNLIKKIFSSPTASNSSKLSKEEQQLQAFFDGELDEKEAEAFRKTHAGASMEVESELEEMSELRSTFKELISDMYSETRQGSGRLTIWQQIEHQVREEAIARRREMEFTKRRFSVTQFTEWFEPFLAPRVILGGSFGIALAFFLGVRAGTVEQNPTQLTSNSVSTNLAAGDSVSSPENMAVNISGKASQVVVNSTPLLRRRMTSRSNQSQQLSNPQFSVVGVSSSSRTHPGIRLKVSRELAQKRTIEHSIPLHIDTDQLIGVPRSKDRKVTIPGGLRAEGADIDWIESDRDFQLLPVKNKTSIPVIWVSGDVRK